MAEGNWYPTTNQIGKPADLERTLRRVLQLHYDLSERVAGMAKEQQAALVAGTKASQVPPVNTAAVTNMLGLPIVPSDTTQLADGTKLTYVAASRNFQFK